MTNRWSAVAPLDTARAGVAAAVAPDGHIWAAVSIYFGSTTTTPVGTGTTNASGALSAAISFRVPNFAAGDQTLIVVDDRSQFPITLTVGVQ